MARQYQEFYCATSGDGCGGYFTVKLNMALNHNVIVKCPSCGHEHHRTIKNGLLHDQGMGGRHSLTTEVIVVPISAFHKEPIVSGHKERTAAKLHDYDNAEVAKSNRFVDWFGRFGAKT